MIKPLNDYVVLKYKKEKNTTESGILLRLDDQKTEQNCIGIVVSCGPKVSEKIKPNAEVVYKSYSGTKITIKDEEYLIVKNEEIIALLI
ncbi:co-chaperone GroES [Candidatus Phytoplasma fraxini]|uniref:10 kDa chaperonin n=1 Tax=Ash yellows phytoplasma TaxID=35780 RepID=A0ABZ2U969_ASHYP